MKNVFTACLVSAAVPLVSAAALSEDRFYGKFPVTVKGYQGTATTSESYGGQIARHVLHESLKKLAAQGDGQPNPKLKAEMMAYFAGSAAGRPIIAPKSKGTFVLEQTAVDQLSKKRNLAGKTYKGAVPGMANNLTGRELVEFWIDKATAADATVSRLASMDDLPKALADELRARNLPAAIRTGLDPLFERDWGTIEQTIGTGRLDEPATLSRAELGMAETGTLLLASGAENPVTLTFLGETHFVVIRAGDIKAGFEYLWADWRKRGLDPRTVNLVTGPSRSADIGQTLQLGAHGPVALHIFVVDA